MTHLLRAHIRLHRTNNRRKNVWIAASSRMENRRRPFEQAIVVRPIYSQSICRCETIGNLGASHLPKQSFDFFRETIAYGILNLGDICQDSDQRFRRQYNAKGSQTRRTNSMSQFLY